ncbi:hypothetical protein ACP275_05G084900 [Erythranthe tilingii]
MDTGCKEGRIACASAASSSATDTLINSRYNQKTVAATLSARLPRIESRSTNYKYASSRLAIRDKLEQLLADFSTTAAVRYRLRNMATLIFLKNLVMKLNNSLILDSSNQIQKNNDDRGYKA